MDDFGFIISLIKTYGYWVIGIGILIECMGIPFPGETVLILGGVAASHGHMNLMLVIIIAAVAAIVGDNLGYMLGRKFGRKIIKKFERFPLFHYKHIDRAENFFKRHGNKTVFIGRFVAVLRTYAAVLAGVFDMPYPAFFSYNLSGGIVWAIIFGFLGFFIGNNLNLLGSIVTNFNLMMVSFVVLFVLWKVGKILLLRRKNSLGPQ